MKIRFACLAIASLLARGASAQSSTQHPAAMSAVGVWRGTSKCLVRQSACKDESVVYRITQTDTPDSLMMDGRKIVGGEEQEMGILSCHFAPSTGSLACSMPQGTWQFRLHRDSLNGELRLPDKTKFRDVRTTRAR
jgi:hypothetical protein